MIVLPRIETSLWNNIRKECIAAGWQIALEYDAWDKGMDHDFVHLKRDNEEMYFGWSNWFEGEIKCTEEQRAEMERQFNVGFSTLEPEALTDNRIGLWLKLLGK